MLNAQTLGQFFELLLSSEFGQRCRVRSRVRRWLQLVGCAALLLDASNFGGPDGVGGSGIEPRRSLRKTEKAKGKKRKADEDNEMDKGSRKKRKEVSNKCSIGRYHTNKA